MELESLKCKFCGTESGTGERDYDGWYLLPGNKNVCPWCVDESPE